jgi:predicted nucleotidyltransferase
MSLESLPLDKRALLDKTVALLSAVPGVQAVVLGGSYARGTHRPGSDLDVGIYYREAAPFQIADIRRVALELAPAIPPDVTDFYAWGAWVNGGAWIHTPVCKVDFIYRNLDQVRRTIDEACQGVTRHDFDQQPAFGFYSVIYLAETNVCLPLYDPSGELARLKAQVAVSPPLLKEKAVASYLWMAEFSLLHADGYAARGDVYATTGTLTRTAAYLTQALFALNETYFMTDKTAMQEIANFAQLPEGYVERLADMLARPGRTPAELAEAIAGLRALWSGVVALTGGSYRPAFRV